MTEPADGRCRGVQSVGKSDPDNEPLIHPTFPNKLKSCVIPIQAVYEKVVNSRT
jgi:hypothetical protein